VTWYGSATPEPPRPADEAADTRGYGEPEAARPRREATFSPTRLWTGGVVTAVIAALLAVVGFLIVGNVLGQSVLGVKPGGDPFAPSMVAYAFSGAVAALLATAVMHLLMLGTPRPFFYFGWIGGLCTVIAVLIPLVTTQHWDVKGATAAANLVLGIAITVLVQGTAHTAIQYPNRQQYPPAG
jgi:hypothetical protein